LTEIACADDSIEKNGVLSRLLPSPRGERRLGAKPWGQV